jgi:quercetin dioxygenase-like cupin family protein
MRRFVAGIDAAGRSGLIEDAPLALKAGRSGDHQMARIYQTGASPPSAPPPGPANFVDVGVGAGILRWLVIQFEPKAEFPMHHTDTIDCVLILDGSVELGLDDGLHLLETGDCVVIPGVDHAWKSGSTGCRLCVTAIGTPPRHAGQPEEPSAG